jgi:glycosyltransferase involved in cell wall biosynthesis
MKPRPADCYRTCVRIAQVVPRGEQPWSGVLTVIVHLAAALARRGHDVEVWQLHEWSPATYAEQRRALDAAGVVEVHVRQRRRLGRSAGMLGEERAIDIVHLHGAFNPSNTAVSSGIRRPYVFSPHSGYDPVSLERSSGRKLIYRWLFERRMLRRAALLVALTDVELEQLRAFGATGPCEVIPNGVEPAPGDVDRHVFRRELAIAPGAMLAVFAGRLDIHRKGLDTLVRGIAGAPGWHLALVGPRFREVERLERMITELGVGERVHLVGERHGRRLQESVSSADLFALTSRWEGLPMVLLEALALARPAVVSPAVERVIGIAAAGAGWVADDSGLGSMLRQIQAMGRDELATRGRAALLLSRRYDWNGVAERYEAAYERARGPRQRVAP